MAQLIRGLAHLAKAPKGAVVTIGNFDGVHIGHQALIKKTIEKSKEFKTQSLVILFEPQPSEFFSKGQQVPRLTRWREKFCLLSEQGIDAVLIIRFNAQFAAMTAEQFVQEVLIHGLQAKHVIVGDDFQFGRGRAGNFALLSSQDSFTAVNMQSVMLDNERISSTRVRNALANADHELAERLLGHPYLMKGRIVHGDKRGRTLGFPTANIDLHRAVVPVQGIYIVRMYGLAEQGLPGVANIGTRPTIGGTRILLEVHLFNFSQNIYGRRVAVEFCEKLRDEAHFASLDLLTEQIKLDAKQAYDYFVKRGEL